MHVGVCNPVSQQVHNFEIKLQPMVEIWLKYV